LKDVVTSYWFDYKMATIDMGDKPMEEDKQRILKTKYAIITIHDVSPIHSERIFCFTDRLRELSVPFNFAMIPRHDEKKSNDIRDNIELVEGVKQYRQDIALHGLYHEKGGDLEEFRHLTFQEACDEIKKGLDIFSELGISTKYFVPPTWTVNKDTMDALNYLHFSITETEQEILILEKNTRLLTNILNWDHGAEILDQLFRQVNKLLFKKKVMSNTEMIRIALHPKDPPEALAEQCEMIAGLVDLNYNFIRYSDIAKLYG
jgi:predicted deacetylase